MENIQAIWNKGNDSILKDETLDSAFIKKSISESSTRITSKLLKAIRLGVVLTSLCAIGFVYNIFFYLNNIPVLAAIIALIVLAISSIAFLLTQVSNIINQDTSIDNLHNLLISRIKFFNTQFRYVVHCLAASVVLLTFTLNLTMENDDGIIELRKILILSVYYIIVYAGLIYLFKKTNSIYLKRLKNALYNLEENSLTLIDKEEKKHKKLSRIILVAAIILSFLGLIAAYIKGDF